MRKPRPLSKKYFEDFDWAYEHYTELAKKYPNKWVAVGNKKILSVSRSSTKALELAHKRVKAEQVPVVFIEKGIHIYAYSIKF